MATYQLVAVMPGIAFLRTAWSLVKVLPTMVELVRHIKVTILQRDSHTTTQRY